MPNTLALLALGFTGNLVAIALLRGAMAITYAVATIGCQTYAIRAGEETGSVRPFGTFMAVVYGGVFCGSALGGLVAGRLGYESAFVCGALISLASGAAGWFAMRGRAGDKSEKITRSPKTRERIRFPIPFAALLTGVAIPMNAATAVFVWYLTPLMLASTGMGPAEIARVVMLYYLAVILFGPAVSYLSDHGPGPVKLIIAGALLSAGALFSLSFWSGFWAMAVAVAGLGIGHTFIRAPQYALAVRLTREAGRGLDYLRMVERLGALAGLGTVALTVGSWGSEQIIRMLAFAVLSGILVYVGANLASRSGRQT
jgi:predicted MFS family arabinose efflux permease